MWEGVNPVGKNSEAEGDLGYVWVVVMNGEGWR